MPPLEIGYEINPKECELVYITDRTYTLVLFPEVQHYMDKIWFKEEAFLVNAPDVVGSAAYVIPTKYIEL